MQRVLFNNPFLISTDVFSASHLALRCSKFGHLISSYNAEVHLAKLYTLAIHFPHHSVFLMKHFSAWADARGYVFLSLSVTAAVGDRHEETWDRFCLLLNTFQLESGQLTATRQL